MINSSLLGYPAYMMIMIFFCGKLFVHLWIFRSAKQIIKRYAKVFRKAQKSRVIGLALTAFIAADAILIHIKIQGKLELGYAFFISQKLKSKQRYSPDDVIKILDLIIPLWYNVDIPFWYISLNL